MITFYWTLYASLITSSAEIVHRIIKWYINSSHSSAKRWNDGGNARFYIKCLLNSAKNAYDIHFFFSSRYSTKAKNKRQEFTITSKAIIDISAIHLMFESNSMAYIKLLRVYTNIFLQVSGKQPLATNIDSKQFGRHHSSNKGYGSTTWSFYVCRLSILVGFSKNSVVNEYFHTLLTCFVNTKSHGINCRMWFRPLIKIDIRQTMWTKQYTWLTERKTKRHT